MEPLPMFSRFCANQVLQHSSVANFSWLLILLVALALTTACGVGSASKSNPLTQTATQLTLRIATQTLSSTTAGSAFGASLLATGGVLPYQWGISSGALPQGLELNPGTGLLSGATDQTGTFVFQAVVTDSQGTEASAQLSILVSPAPLGIATQALPSATAGSAFDASLLATGGVLPYKWGISSGALPQGLGLNPGTGLLSGATDQTGTFAFQAVVTDSQGMEASAPLSILVLSNYGMARTDTSIVQPQINPPNMGGLIGAGTCARPHDFGIPICRITDSSLDPSLPNRSLVTTSSGSGDLTLWNTNSTLLSVQDEGGRIYPISFHPSTMRASRLYPTNTNYSAKGGYWIEGGGTAWSYRSPTVLYTLHGTLLQSYNFAGYNTGGDPPAATTVFDFRNYPTGTSTHCLPSTYSSTWTAFGETSKYPADQVFVGGESNAGGQGSGGDVVAYKVGSGCSYLNTLTGWVTGDWGTTGTVAIPDRFYVHNVKISKDGQWALVSQAGCVVNPSITSISLTSNLVTAVASSTSGLLVGMNIDVTGVSPSLFNVKGVTLTSVNAETNKVQWAQTGDNATGSGGRIDNCLSQSPYLWQIGTANLYPSCTKGGKCGGHVTEGVGHMVNANYSPFWQQDIRLYGDDNAGTPFIPELPLSNCTDAQTDQHQGWSNVDADDTYPFFASTTAFGANAQIPGSYNCAWVNEILGISPITGTVYRFAHTYATGLSWSFDAQNAIGGVSQDGRFFAFTSDWMRTLGTEGGANGACTDSPKSSTACRTDVFVVNLEYNP
jgi:Putative Ig domain